MRPPVVAGALQKEIARQGGARCERVGARPDGMAEEGCGVGLELGRRNGCRRGIGEDVGELVSRLRNGDDEGAGVLDLDAGKLGCLAGAMDLVVPDDGFQQVGKARVGVFAGEAVELEGHVARGDRHPVLEPGVGPQVEPEAGSAVQDFPGRCQPREQRPGLGVEPDQRLVDLPRRADRKGLP